MAIRFLRNVEKVSGQRFRTSRDLPSDPFIAEIGVEIIKSFRTFLIVPAHSTRCALMPEEQVHWDSKLLSTETARSSVPSHSTSPFAVSKKYGDLGFSATNSNNSGKHTATKSRDAGFFKDLSSIIFEPFQQTLGDSSKRKICAWNPIHTNQKRIWSSLSSYFFERLVFCSLVWKTSKTMETAACWRFKKR